MKKKKILSLLSLLVLLVSLPITAGAHPVPDAGRTGSITVCMCYAGKPLPGGNLTIYQVGEVAEEDGNYRFVPTEEFDSWNGEFGDLENAGELAKSLSRFVTANKLSGTSVSVDKNGEAKFSDLEQGVYLLTQAVPAKGYNAISPFLVSLPYLDGDTYIYDVTTVTKNELEKVPEPTKPSGGPPSGGKLPQTGQLWWPVPLLICAGLACIASGLVRRREG